MDSDLADLREEELIRRARTGSSACFGVLAERYRGRLLRYLGRQGPLPHDAEDLVQDTFVKAYRNLGAYDPSRAFSTWLFTIAVRLAATHWHARKREVPAEGLDPVDVCTAEPAAAVEQAGDRAHLWALAEKLLSPRQHTALRLRYAREMPVKEIARTMRLTAIHVKVLLFRARKRLLVSSEFVRNHGGPDAQAAHDADGGAP